MSWHRIEPTTTGTEPDAVKVGIQPAGDGHSMTVQIGRAAAARLDFSAGDKLAIDWGDGEDAGKLRIRKVSVNGFKARNMNSKSLTVRTRVLPPALRRQKVRSQACEWEQVGDAAVIVLGPGLLVPEKPVENAAPESLRDTPPTTATTAPKNRADAAFAAAGQRFEDVPVRSRRK